MVHGCQLRAVGTGRTFVLCLLGRWRDALGTSRGQFCSGWASGCSAGAAVIANVVHRSVVDHRRVVNVVNVGDVHVVHRTVVIQSSIIPVCALVAGTAVAVAIIDAAVEADLWAPVAGMPEVLLGILVDEKGFEPSASSLRTRKNLR